MRSFRKKKSKPLISIRLILSGKYKTEKMAIKFAKFPRHMMIVRLSFKKIRFELFEDDSRFMTEVLHRAEKLMLYTTIPKEFLLIDCYSIPSVLMVLTIIISKILMNHY